MSKYLFWTWNHAKGIRLNSLIRIFVGIVRVALGLLMVWLCKRFIDVSIRSGSSHDILLMIGLLVGTVVSIIIMRQVYYYMTVSANAPVSVFISTSTLAISPPGCRKILRP